MAKIVDGIRLRVLLDRCRLRIATLLGAASWIDLRRTFVSEAALLKSIHSALSKTLNPASGNQLMLEDIKVLCSSNSVRDLGVSLAHNATEEEISESVSRINKRFYHALFFFETGKYV